LHDAELPKKPIGPNDLVMRGSEDERLTALAPAGDPTVLPYATIHYQLQFVEALQRLVIVDACQAEAIFDNIADRGFDQRAMLELTNGLSHRAQTSYILATRRGELEPEPDQLGHGILTYALLRGMGEPKLVRPREVDDIFRPYPTADFDQDGWIAAGELQRFARLTVPELAARYPGATRASAGPRVLNSSSPAPVSISADLDGSSAFRLIKAPQ
jgi:hypothetical protein